MILRNSGELFINLFTMMKSCGIRNADDIGYIRDALCLGTTKEAALENFRKKLQVCMSIYIGTHASNIRC